MAKKPTKTSTQEPEFERYSYKELAALLNISTDAARMRAKRKAAKGGWQIIPGNHPAAKVTVLIPADAPELKPERDGGDAPERNERNSARTNAPEQDERLFALYTEAQERITALTDQLVASQEAHRNDAIALAGSEAREMGLAAELHAATEHITELQNQVALYRRSWWQRITGKV